MRHLLLIIVSLFFLPLAQAQSSTKQAPPVASEQNTGSPSKTSNPSVPVVPDDYKIGPQDVIRIDVWKEPDITRSIPVRPDGKITLPLLNDVQAAGLTA